jgi:hypothetical protein
MDERATFHVLSPDAMNLSLKASGSDSAAQLRGSKNAAGTN